MIGNGMFVWRENFAVERALVPFLYSEMSFICCNKKNKKKKDKLTFFDRESSILLDKNAKFLFTMDMKFHGVRNSLSAQMNP